MIKFDKISLCKSCDLSSKLDALYTIYFIYFTLFAWTRPFEVEIFTHLIACLKTGP